MQILGGEITMSDIGYPIGVAITLFIAVVAGIITADAAVNIFIGFLGGLAARPLHKRIFGAKEQKA